LKASVLEDILFVGDAEETVETQGWLVGNTEEVVLGLDFGEVLYLTLAKLLLNIQKLKACFRLSFSFLIPSVTSF
jgi:hypothetical protein